MQGLGRLSLATGLAVFGYLLLYRPIQLHWGATQEEVLRAMPGDDIQPTPIFNATRAITIRARPEAIWPWLVQMGYRRAGWYGYDWIDNDGIPSSTTILPQWQNLKVGDTIPIWKNIDFPVVMMEANRTLVFASKSSPDSMVLGLYPRDADHTRLVWRIRLGPYNWNSRWILTQFFTDLADFIAVRQNMQGIEARAEGAAPVAPQEMYAKLALWLVALLSFFASELAVVFRKPLRKPLLAAATTSLITVWMVLTSPPVWICALATLSAWTLFWWAIRGKKVTTTTSGDLRAST
jgi:hypothetical protein